MFALEETVDVRGKAGIKTGVVSDINVGEGPPLRMRESGETMPGCNID